MSGTVYGSRFSIKPAVEAIRGEKTFARVAPECHSSVRHPVSRAPTPHHSRALAL